MRKTYSRCPECGEKDLCWEDCGPVERQFCPNCDWKQHLYRCPNCGEPVEEQTSGDFKCRNCDWSGTDPD